MPPTDSTYGISFQMVPVFELDQLVFFDRMQQLDQDQPMGQHRDVEHLGLVHLSI